MKALVIAGFLAASLSACSQDAAPRGELARQVSAMLSRVASGHALTAEEIAAEQAAETPAKADAVREAIPFLLKALADHDPLVRAYGLAMLTGLEERGRPAAAPKEARAVPAGGTPASEPAPAPDAEPSSPDRIVFNGFSLEIIGVLVDAIPALAARLTDDVPSNRMAAAEVFDGFLRQPPSAATASLLAFLRRDDAVGPVGQAVAGDLLDYGPMTEDTAAGLARYLRRRDQTPESRTELVDLIAGSPNQSQRVNAALVTYLNGDDGSLRARLILSLPGLDLAPDLFADTRTRVAGWAEGGQDSLQVTTAAKSIAACWTAPRMKTPCPAYENDATPARPAP